jgi:hypothetical protein
MIEKKQKGCVYFFKHVGLTPIKIGCSTNESPIDRFTQFSTYAPFGAQIIGFITCEEPFLLEKTLHQKFVSKRLMGEWFDLNETDVSAVIKFYSSLEDIKEKNDFEIEWAKIKNQKKLEIEAQFENLSTTDIKKKFYNFYKNNKHVKKIKLADIFKVSRQTVHLWINEYEKLNLHNQNK